MQPRRIATVIVIALFLGSGSLATGQAAAGSAQLPAVQNSYVSPAVQQFLALEARGLGGSFELTYHLDGYPDGHGLSGDGTLTVAQRGAPASSPWPTGPGEWSFRLTLGPRATFQWVEIGSEATDCWAWPRHPAMTCTGPGTYESSIGFVLATLPFIPGSVFDGLEADVGGTDGRTAEPASVFQTRGSAITGPLLCLRENVSDSSTVCLTHDGLVASVAPFLEMGLSFGSVVLASRTATLSVSAFVLDARPVEPFRVLPT